MLDISRLLETHWTKTLASWKAEAGNIHPLAFWHSVKVQLRREQDRREAGQESEKKRRLLWPHLLNRRSPQEWCWQCGKMCFSWTHAQKCMSTCTNGHTLATLFTAHKWVRTYYRGKMYRPKNQLVCLCVWFWYSKLLNQTSKKFISVWPNATVTQSLWNWNQNQSLNTWNPNQVSVRTAAASMKLNEADHFKLC